MAFPEPLKIEEARLAIDDGKVIDAVHGDWYFQYEGRDETRYVYLEGSGLLDRLAANEDLVVGEIGFGTGLTFALVQQAMAETGYTGRLDYIGVEARPLTAAQAAQANALRDPSLHWLPQSETPRAGFVSSERESRGGARLMLLHGDAAQALARLSAQVDVWFLDGFSPAKNPDMWTDAIFSQLARLSRPGAQLSSFTAAGDVRRGLEAAGFSVGKRPGWAKKREHLTAAYAGSWHHRTRPDAPLNVAGTGVAGLNVALAAEDAGWRAVLHGAGTVPEGSAVPHALVNFRPSGDRGPFGHLRRAAFFHLAPYAAFAERGVEAVVSDARLRERWATERDVTHQWLGTDRVLVNDALSVDTHAFRTATLERIEHRADTLDAMPAPGILAAGLGSLELVDGLRLNPNRGQQDRVKLDERAGFERPLNFGRLLLPAKDQTAWLGASFDRSPPDDWRAPRGSDSAENLARLTAAFPESGATLTGESWVGLRATTPDHLPLTGWLGENLGVLTGLGSKGYLYAPILASCLFAEALGRPLPLETWVWQALHPHRFNPLES